MGLQIIIADQDIGIQDFNSPFGRAAAHPTGAARAAQAARQDDAVLRPLNSRLFLLLFSAASLSPVWERVRCWVWGVRVQVWCAPRGADAAVLLWGIACAEAGLTFPANRSHSRKKSCSTSRRVLSSQKGSGKGFVAEVTGLGFFNGCQEGP